MCDLNERSTHSPEVPIATPPATQVSHGSASAPREATTRRILELDGLRCFAILAVIGVHYRPPHLGLVNQLLAMGWSGVDLFFAISGFLITSILLGMRHAPHPLRSFYARRSARIFPPYYLVLSIICLVTLAQHLFLPRWLSIGGFIFAPSLSSQPIVHAARTAFLTHTLDHATSSIDLHQLHEVTEGLFVLWSLSVEEVFYLVWAPVVLRGSRRLIVACAVVPILLCPVLRVLAHTSSFPEYTAFIFRADSLSTGACLALLMAATRDHSGRRSRLRQALPAVLAISAAVLALILWRTHAIAGVETRSTLLFSFAGYTALALFSSSAVGLCALHAGGRHPVLRMLRWKPILFVGTISYTIYLIHIPMYVATRGTLLRLHLPVDSAVAVSTLALATTIAVAALSWRYLERPILAWKDRRF